MKDQKLISQVFWCVPIRHVILSTMLPLSLVYSISEACKTPPLTAHARTGRERAGYARMLPLSIVLLQARCHVHSNEKSEFEKQVWCVPNRHVIKSNTLHLSLLHSGARCHVELTYTTKKNQRLISKFCCVFPNQHVTQSTMLHLSLVYSLSRAKRKNFMSDKNFLLCSILPLFNY